MKFLKDSTLDEFNRFGRTRDINEFSVVTVKRIGPIDHICRAYSVRKKGYGDGSARVSHVNDSKLDNNLSRARSTVKEIALCNEWQYFITLTIDKNKHDRFDLAGYKKKLGKFINNCNNRYGYDLKYLLIPEFHKDGAVHMHGLIYGIPHDELFDNEYGFLDWPRYRDKFGFCSLSSIKNHIRVCNYITKYITKSLKEHSDELGKHVYMCSQGLKRGVIVFRQVDCELTYYSYENDYCQIQEINNLKEDYHLYIDDMLHNGQ